MLVNNRYSKVARLLKGRLSVDDFVIGKKYTEDRRPIQGDVFVTLLEAGTRFGRWTSTRRSMKKLKLEKKISEIKMHGNTKLKNAAGIVCRTADNILIPSMNKMAEPLREDINTRRLFLSFALHMFEFSTPSTVSVKMYVKGHLKTNLYPDAADEGIERQACSCPKETSFIPC